MCKFIIHSSVNFINVMLLFLKIIALRERGTLMNQTQSVLSCYKLFWTRAFDVHGRSTRGEFWYPFSFHLVIHFLLSRFIYSVLDEIFLLIIIIPSLTVMTRRLHDTNRKMWSAVVIHVIGLLAIVVNLLSVVFDIMSVKDYSMMVVIVLLVFIIYTIFSLTAFYALVAMYMKGDEKPNKYGDGGTYRLLNSTTTAE